MSIFVRVIEITLIISIPFNQAKSQRMESANIVSTNIIKHKKHFHQKKNTKPYDQSMWSISRKGIQNPKSALKKRN